MKTTAWLLAAVLGALGTGHPAAAMAADPVARFTAFAVDMTGLRGRARSGTVDIAIERWTTDAESSRLMAAMRENGRDGLLKSLRDVDRLGYIRSGGSLGYPLRFARQWPLASGGRRILLATDRQIAFLEAGRTRDYPFMVIDIRIGPDGEGEGRLLPLARITVNEDQVFEIENYSALPVRLTSVRSTD